MQFAPQIVGTFQEMPGTTPDNVQGTAAMMPGQNAAFRKRESVPSKELEGHREASKTAKPEPATRPGGGIGPLIGAPDPLQDYRVPILSCLTILVVAGAAYAHRKSSCEFSLKRNGFTQTSSNRVVKTRRGGGRTAARAREPESYARLKT